MKLTNTQDFVIEKWSIDMSIEDRISIRNHAKFLKKDIEVSMLVPCDEMGNIFDAPTCHIIKDNLGETQTRYDGDEVTKFGDAMSKILFNGVEKFQVPGGNIIYRLNGYPILLPDDNGKYQVFRAKKIEDLIPYDVELTATAEKMIL